jgi:hypothetical protein
MKTFVRALALCVAVFGCSVSASAQGTLSLTTLYGGNSDIIEIQQQDGSGFFGTLTRNGIPQTVTGTFVFNGIILQIGDESFHLVSHLFPDVHIWEGPISRGRSAAFFATYKANRNVWLLDGVIGEWDDFTGKVQVDQVNLSWGKTKLRLDALGGGQCSGEARVGGTTTHTFSCTSSGTLTDAFFAQPRFLLWFILNLYS